MQGLHGASQDLYWALKSRLSSVRSLQNRYLVYMAAILLNEQKLQCQSLRHFQQFLMCSSLVIKATVHFSKLTWLLPKSRTKVGAHGSVRACLHPRMAREVPGPGDAHVTHWHTKMPLSLGDGATITSFFLCVRSNYLLTRVNIFSAANHCTAHTCTALIYKWRQQPIAISRIESFR